MYDIEDPTQSSRVLKDVWIDSDRAREGDDLTDITNQLKKNGDAALGHFLTMIVDGDVHVNGQSDDTLLHIRHGRALEPNHWLRANSPTNAETQKAAASEERARGRGELGHPSHQSSIGGVPTMVRYQSGLDQQRQHYRVVFEEIGIPLHELDEFKLMFIGMKGCIISAPIRSYLPFLMTLALMHSWLQHLERCTVSYTFIEAYLILPQPSVRV